MEALGHKGHLAFESLKDTSQVGGSFGHKMTGTIDGHVIDIQAGGTQPSNKFQHQLNDKKFGSDRFVGTFDNEPISGESARRLYEKYFETVESAYNRDVLAKKANEAILEKPKVASEIQQREELKEFDAKNEALNRLLN